MEVLLVVLAILVVFDLAALRWGKDSRDGLDSSEWQRGQFSSFHPIGRNRLVHAERLCQAS